MLHRCNLLAGVDTLTCVRSDQADCSRPFASSIFRGISLCGRKIGDCIAVSRTLPIHAQERHHSDLTAHRRAASRRIILTAQLSGLAGLHSVVLKNAAARQNYAAQEILETIARDFQRNQCTFFTLPVGTCASLLSELKADYITGRLSPDIYTKDCIFVDPTTRVQGVETYCKAVASLFDKDQSRADLISIEVVNPQVIKTRWRFAASLNIPGKPKLKPYTGTTLYSINTAGKIYEHREEWDISALDAFVSILFPAFGAPPASPIPHPVDI